MSLILPDRLHGVVGLDLETRDDGISAKKGSGWPWRGGHVAGYAVVADNFSGYLPIGHEGGGNLDPDLVHRWLRDMLCDDTQLKVGANLQYDLGWASTEGITVKGPVRDVQWAEALLDEHRFSYSLDVIAKDRLGEGKDETGLVEAAARLGIAAKDMKGHLWRLHAAQVAPYAIQDADLPRRLWTVQEPLLQAEELLGICELEHALLPMYLDLRRRGVRIDVDRAEQLLARLRTEVRELEAELAHRVGFAVNVRAAASLARAFDQEGLTYGRTAKTQAPSITAELLKATRHWLPELVLKIRQKDKLAGTFLENVILGNLHGGRVHGEIHPLRSDDGGTVSGRLSMSDPNLQFIPKRTEEGKLIRQCFLPEEGEHWASLDHSQQEPRLLIHFASLVIRDGKALPGAIEARDRYRTDPALDYHAFAAELTGLLRDPAKILNLAIIYGRGIKTTAAELKRSIEETKEMFEQHQQEMPFVRALAEVCQSVVKSRGYLRSLLGRRSRFPFWEPSEFGLRDKLLPLEQAHERWPGKRLVRARLHKALNSLVQPSAADQTKAGMLAVWQAGLGRHVLIQIHDELCCSVPDKGVASEIARLMEDAVKLEVPSKVGIKLGERWGLT